MHVLRLVTRHRSRWIFSYFLLPLLFLLAVPTAVHAHGDAVREGMSRGTAVLILTTLSLVGLFYWRGVRRVWNRFGTGRVIETWRPVAFGAGLLAIAVALVSPLERWSGELFAAHMVQHVLLLLVAAPALVLGLSPGVVAWLLPASWRRPFAQRLHTFSGYIQQGFGWPLFVWGLYAISLWVWHIPALYEAAVTSEWIHGLEHASFLGAAVLFWWTLAYSRGHHFYTLALLFIFTTALHSGLLGVLLTFAKRPLYAVYEQPRASVQWSLSALADQQLAGAIMWVIAGVVYLIAMLTLLNAWLNLTEREESV